MSSEEFKYRVTNIVCKARLPFEPDILTLAMCDVCDLRLRFSGGKKRMNYSTCIVFESGAVLSLGAKRAVDAKRDLLNFVSRICSALFKPVYVPHCTVVNCVGTFSRSHGVHLPLFCYYLEANGYKPYYEPELSSRLHVEIDGATILLHHSGKGIIAKGYASDCYMCDVLAELKKLCCQFEK